MANHPSARIRVAFSCTVVRRMSALVFAVQCVNGRKVIEELPINRCSVLEAEPCKGAPFEDHSNGSLDSPCINIIAIMDERLVDLFDA